jgi:hypothetical protein
MTFQEIKIIATGPFIANQLRDVNTIWRKIWHIAAYICKIYDFKIEIVPFIINFSTVLASGWYNLTSGYTGVFHGGTICMPMGGHIGSWLCTLEIWAVVLLLPESRALINDLYVMLHGSMLQIKSCYSQRWDCTTWKHLCIAWGEIVLLWGTSV